MKTETYPNKQVRLSFLIISKLLIALVWFFYLGCSQDLENQSPIKSSKNPVEYDHNNPDKQKRMGIYHYNEGNKLLRKKKLSEAIKNYKMALQHTPSFLEASINLTTAYLQGKMFDEAHKTLKTLQEKNPKNPLLFYNLACYYALTIETASSLQALQTAVKLGFKNFKQIKSDPDLENLRKDPNFDAWIKGFS